MSSGSHNGGGGKGNGKGDGKGGSGGKVPVVKGGNHGNGPWTSDEDLDLFRQAFVFLVNGQPIDFDKIIIPSRKKRSITDRLQNYTRDARRKFQASPPDGINPVRATYVPRKRDRKDLDDVEKDDDNEEVDDDEAEDASPPLANKTKVVPKNQLKRKFDDDSDDDMNATQSSKKIKA